MIKLRLMKAGVKWLGVLSGVRFWRETSGKWSPSDQRLLAQVKVDWNLKLTWNQIEIKLHPPCEVANQTNRFCRFAINRSANIDGWTNAADQVALRIWRPCGGTVRQTIAWILYRSISITQISRADNRRVFAHKLLVTAGHECHKETWGSRLAKL